MVQICPENAQIGHNRPQTGQITNNMVLKVTNMVPTVTNMVPKVTNMVPKVTNISFGPLARPQRYLTTKFASDN